MGISTTEVRPPIYTESYTDTDEIPDWKDIDPTLLHRIDV